MKPIDKKVVVTKLSAFIPLRAFLKIVGQPSLVFESKNFEIPLNLDKLCSKDVALVSRPALGQYWTANIDNLFVKDTVVRFNEIEDYTHYQTEINFDESI